MLETLLLNTEQIILNRHEDIINFWIMVIYVGVGLLVSSYVYWAIRKIDKAYKFAKLHNPILKQFKIIFLLQTLSFIVLPNLFMILGTLFWIECIRATHKAKQSEVEEINKALSLFREETKKTIQCKSKCADCTCNKEKDEN